MELEDKLAEVDVPITIVRFKDRNVRGGCLQPLVLNLRLSECLGKEDLCFIPDVGNPDVTGELHTIGFAEEKFRSYYEISKCTIKGSTCVFECVGN